MAFPCLVALAVTTLSSLAGHLPSFSHSKKLARLRRCWIVEWNHSALQGASFQSGRKRQEVSV
jgi:hypothetical protein